MLSGGDPEEGGGAARSARCDDDCLRVAFASAFLTSCPTDACPEPEELWDALHGAPDAALRQRVVDHVATCPVCAEAWRLAARTAPEAP